jgi:hypothetical protein
MSDLLFQMGTLLNELFFCAAEVCYEELPDVALDFCLLNNEVAELMEVIE